MTKYNPKSCINSEKWTKFVPQHIWTCRSWSPHGCKLNEAYIYSSIVSIVFTLTSHLVYVKCDVNILNSSNHLYNQRYAHFWRTWLCSVTKKHLFSSWFTFLPFHSSLSHRICSLCAWENSSRKTGSLYDCELHPPRVSFIFEYRVSLKRRCLCYSQAM